MNFEEFEKRYEKEHNVFCPYCGHKQDEETVSENCVTYHGDGDDHKIDCDECGEDFYVKENVDRTFKSKKIKGE